MFVRNVLINNNILHQFLLISSLPVLPPLVMNHLDKRGVLRRLPWIGAPLQVTAHTCPLYSSIVAKRVYITFGCCQMSKRQNCIFLFELLLCFIYFLFYSGRSYSVGQQARDIVRPPGLFF